MRGGGTPGFSASRWSYQAASKGRSGARCRQRSKWSFDTGSQCIQAAIASTQTIGKPAGSVSNGSGNSGALRVSPASRAACRRAAAMGGGTPAAVILFGGNRGLNRGSCSGSGFDDLEREVAEGLGRRLLGVEDPELVASGRQLAARQDEHEGPRVDGLHRRRLKGTARGDTRGVGGTGGAGRADSEQLDAEAEVGLRPCHAEEEG